MAVVSWGESIFGVHATVTTFARPSFRFNFVLIPAFGTRLTCFHGIGGSLSPSTRVTFLLGTAMGPACRAVPATSLVLQRDIFWLAV